MPINAVLFEISRHFDKNTKSVAFTYKIEIRTQLKRRNVCF